MVDNGLENEEMWQPMKSFKEKIDVPLEVISLGRNILTTMFHTLITEQQFFTKKGINHVCFL